MQKTNRWMVTALAMGALLLLACADAAAKANEAKTPPSTVEKIEGTNISRVTLTTRAAERLAIKTEPIGVIPLAPRSIAGAPVLPRLVITYAAVIYDTSGATWVYTNPSHLVYVREPISIDFVQDGIAALFSGPPTGTQVVVAGAAELYGAETGVGK